MLNFWDFLQRQIYLFHANLHASNSSCLTALARTSSTMLNRGGRVRILGFIFFFLAKKPSVFHCQSLLSTVLLPAWFFIFWCPFKNWSAVAIQCYLCTIQWFTIFKGYTSYYKILAIMLLYNVSLILYLIMYISYLPTPILPSFRLSPLVTIILNFLWYSLVCCIPHISDIIQYLSLISLSKLSSIPLYV